METEYLPKIAMSIHAHPDDQEFTVAGTLAKWARLGCQVISVIITSGDSGSNDPAHNTEYKSTLAELREGEQRAANARLGVRETLFLRYPDGELEATVPLRRELTRLIRLYKPDVVVTGNMEVAFYGNEYINHPDHRAAAEAATYAVFPSAGTRLIFTDLLEAGYEPHNVKRLYIHGTDKPDTWVDISQDIQAKIEALRQHASQLGDWDPEKMIREWAAGEGQARDIAFAEAYKVMLLVRDEEQA
ncbi:MAG: PIG-L deacetylase family protein [Chloroflexota bacterium]|jgi:LmbE family N-acetylglucosaminyl deacetylase